MKFLLGLFLSLQVHAGWYPPVGLGGGQLARMRGDLSLLSQNDVRFFDSDSSNYIALQAPATIGTNFTYTFPSAVCSSGQVLSFADGSGTLQCATVSGVGSVSNVAYTPSTIQGFGTVTNPSCYYSYESGTKMLNINCKFQTGSTTANEARVSLPAGYTISNDSNKINNFQMCGFARAWSAAAVDVWQIPIIQKNVTYINFSYINAATASLVQRNGNDVVASNTDFTFYCDIPID